MKTTPFFSIIIPTFNRAHLLPKAIDSVLAQTYTDWELIIVDDGSTDNTSELIRKIEDDRVRYVYQQNAERCAARNNGIAHADGRYICFLDSDDYYLPERLALLYAELQKRNFPVEMFYTGVMRDIGKLDRLNFKYDNNPPNVFDNIVRNTIGNPQVCVSIEILNEFKYNTRFHIGEDVELWLRVATRYKLTYLEGQYTFVVIEHNDRSVNVMRYNSGAEQLKLYRYILSDEHSGKRISEGVKGFLLAGSYHAIARYNIHQHNRVAAANALLNALKVDRKSDWFKFRLNILFKLVTLSSMDKVKGVIDYV